MKKTVKEMALDELYNILGTLRHDGVGTGDINEIVVATLKARRDKVSEEDILMIVDEIGRQYDEVE